MRSDAVSWEKTLGDRRATRLRLLDRACAALEVSSKSQGPTRNHKKRTRTIFRASGGNHWYTFTKGASV
jgi:hypothetical protein